VGDYPYFISPYYDVDTCLRYNESDDVMKYSTLFTPLLHCLLIYYTCDVNICVENVSWHTYAMHSVLPPEPGVTVDRSSTRVPVEHDEVIMVSCIGAYSLSRWVPSTGQIHAAAPRRAHVGEGNLCWVIAMEGKALTGWSHAALAKLHCISVDESQEIWPTISGPYGERDARVGPGHQWV
jgi:hypothetical protein